MSESCWGLVIVGDEGALDWCADLPVVPDGGGEGQEAGRDAGAGAGAGEGPPTVLFEGELALEGVNDRFDPLAAAGELAEPGGFVLAVGTDQVRAQAGGDEVLEVAPGEALVTEDDLPGADQVVAAFQQGGHDLAFPQPGMGQAPDDRHAVGGGDQIQPEPPEEPRMAGAVSVAGMPGQIRALHGLAAGRARQRRG